MKAYVIKNKEGKYWCGNNIFSATMDIRKIYICEDFDFISKVINKLLSESLLKDCEVVEITIAEGNLEQQLAIYKRALELENEERFKNIDSIWMIEDDNKTKFINTAEELTNYFLDKAKKKLEEQEKGETRC